MPWSAPADRLAAARACGSPCGSRAPTPRCSALIDRDGAGSETKSQKLVQVYALEDAAFLLKKKVKMIVIACNTASAMALDYLNRCLDIPIVGVVIPGSEGAVRETKNGKVGVIGTSATINSMAYEKNIIARAPDTKVYSAACPLLVPLVEEGLLAGQITVLVLENYLEKIVERKIDTLILGCTHYPLLHDTIKNVVGEGIKLIDSGNETAAAVKKVLQKNNMLNNSSKKDEDQFYVSDIPQKFEEIGARFLEEPLVSVKRIDFEEFLENNHSLINNLKSKATLETLEAGR